jgi:hypothetical protein
MHFKTELLKSGGNTTGIEVPSEIVETLGKRAAVKVSVNDYQFRSTIGTMGGKSLIPFSSEHRQASGINGGDPIDVEIELDAEPRTLAVPDDLAAALAADPQHATAFEKLSPSAKKAHITSVEGAKSADTRQRRIEKVIASLG